MAGSSRGWSECGRACADRAREDRRHPRRSASALALESGLRAGELGQPPALQLLQDRPQGLSPCCQRVARTPHRAPRPGSAPAGACAARAARRRPPPWPRRAPVSGRSPPTLRRRSRRSRSRRGRRRAGGAGSTRSAPASSAGSCCCASVWSRATGQACAGSWRRSRLSPSARNERVASLGAPLRLGRPRLAARSLQRFCHSWPSTHTSHAGSASRCQAIALARACAPSAVTKSKLRVKPRRSAASFRRR